MLKHMKYELKKTMFSKLVILVVMAIAEVLFMIGLFGKLDTPLQWGIFGLCMCALVGIFYIGIESIVVLHKDLNTKQSYMLFMTPYNSYTILGAKIIENAVAIFVVGAFFVALAAVDFTMAVVYLDGLQALLDMIQEFLKSIRINIDISLDQVIMFTALMLVSWVMTIVTAYLSIILSATVLAGKKLSGFVSFVIYLVINYAAIRILNVIPETLSPMTLVTWEIVLAAVLTAVMYVISGWIMEKKLSV